MKELRAAFLIVVAMCLQLHCVLGDYELQVQFHRYVNPTSRCEDCRKPSGAVTCCDGNNTSNCTGPELCDNFFFHCLKVAPNTTCLQGCSRNATFVDADDITSLVPLRFTVPGTWEGIQFFTDVRDDDGQLGFTNTDKLVDEFPINLTTSFLIPGANFTAATFYTGSFGFGTLQLSFRVSCAANFFGPNCATDCVHQCDTDVECRDGNNTFTCEYNAGFTGADCMTDCEGVDCGNGVCRDTGVTSFTCECNTGFTGSQCLTNIDDCVNASCGQNGECVDQINSFTCMCDTGFTGADCMTNIDDCASANCSENSQCVDGVDSFSCVCSPGFQFNGTFCEKAASQDDSPGNTSAIIGGVLGGLGSIVLVLILVFLLVIAMRKTRQNKIGGSDVTVTEVIPADNPTYDSATISHLPRNSSVAMVATTALNSTNSTRATEYEREFDNSIYGSGDFGDAGDSTSIDYTARASVQHS